LDRYNCHLHAYCWMSNHIHMTAHWPVSSGLILGSRGRARPTMTVSR
jgi:hypothetical protein